MVLVLSLGRREGAIRVIGGFKKGEEGLGEKEKLDKLLHELQKRSVDRMCDQDVWKTVDHRLLVQALDAVKRARKEWPSNE